MPFADSQGVRIHYETVGQGPPLIHPTELDQPAELGLDYQRYAEILPGSHDRAVDPTHLAGP